VTFLEIKFRIQFGEKIPARVEGAAGIGLPKPPLVNCCASDVKLMIDPTVLSNRLHFTHVLRK
jgi:hypothetical protein